MRLPIAVHGRRDVVLATVACGALAAGGAWLARDHAGGAVLVVVAVLAWALVVALHRDPERTAPVGDRLVLAPADGRVTALEEVDEPEFLGGRAVRLRVVTSPLDVHVNRAPLACEIVQVDQRRGVRAAASGPHADSGNEAAALRLLALGGRVRMIVRQVTGAPGRRIVCPTEPGTSLAAGERYGMNHVGSRTEVWLRADQPVTWRVAAGDPVRAGLTVLGELGPAPGAGAGEE